MGPASDPAGLDSENEGTSGSEVAQYDPEEFHYRPKISDLPNDLKRVPPQKLTEIFEAMRNHDESALRNVCRVIKLMPPRMAGALGISVSGVKGMHPRFVAVLRDKLFSKLIDISHYNTFCRRRRGGSGRSS